MLANGEQFTLTLSDMKYETICLTQYFKEWKTETTNISVVNGKANIVLKSCDNDDDLHFEVTTHNAPSNTILAGCIQSARNIVNPIFVVGSPRSGTSIVTKAIANAKTQSLTSETHILTAFSDIELSLNKQFYESKQSQLRDMAISRFPSTYVKAEMIKMIRNAYFSTFSNKAFVDKTPGKLMLSMLPTAIYAFPNAKVVFCKRRAIENVYSRMNKFKGMTFEQHVNGWVACFEAWHQVSESINKLLKRNNWSTEIEQFDISHNTSRATENLASILGLNEVQYKKIIDIFSSETPEKSSDTSKPFSNLQATKWTLEEQKIFMNVCSPMMQKVGYSFDDTYYS